MRRVILFTLNIAVNITQNNIQFLEGTAILSSCNLVGQNVHSLLVKSTILESGVQ